MSNCASTFATLNTLIYHYTCAALLLQKPPGVESTPGHEGGGAALTGPTESVSSRESEARFRPSLSRQVDPWSLSRAWFI